MEEVIIRCINQLLANKQPSLDNEITQIYGYLLDNPGYQFNIFRIFRFSVDLSLEQLVRCNHIFINFYLIKYQLLQLQGLKKYDCQGQLRQLFQDNKMTAGTIANNITSVKAKAEVQLKLIVLQQALLKYRLVLQKLLRIKEANDILNNMELSTVIRQKYQQMQFLALTEDINLDHFSDIKRRFQNFDQKDDLLRQEFRNNLVNYKQFKQYQREFLMCYSRESFLEQLAETLQEESINDASYRDMSDLRQIQISVFHVVKYLVYLYDVTVGQDEAQNRSFETISDVFPRIEKVLQQFLFFLTQYVSNYGGFLLLGEILQLETVKNSIRKADSMINTIFGKDVSAEFTNHYQTLQNSFDQMLRNNIDRIVGGVDADELVARERNVHTIAAVQLQEYAEQYDGALVQAQLNTMQRRDTEDVAAIWHFLAHFVYGNGQVQLGYTYKEDAQLVRAAHAYTVVPASTLDDAGWLQRGAAADGDGLRAISVGQPVSRLYMTAAYTILATARLLRGALDVERVAEAARRRVLDIVARDAPAERFSSADRVVQDQQRALWQVGVVDGFMLLLQSVGDANAAAFPNADAPRPDLHRFARESFRRMLQPHFDLRLHKDDAVNQQYRRQNFAVSQQVKAKTEELMRFSKLVSVAAPRVQPAVADVLTHQYARQVILYYTGARDDGQGAPQGFLTSLKQIFATDKQIIKISRNNIDNIQLELDYIIQSLTYVNKNDYTNIRVLEVFKEVYHSFDKIQQFIGECERLRMFDRPTLTQVVSYIHKQFIGGRQDQRHLAELVQQMQQELG